MRRGRPALSLEMSDLGRVDPFRLRLVEEPPASGNYFLYPRGEEARRVPMDLAGLAVVGAAQALFSLSAKWLTMSAREIDTHPIPPVAGEVRVLLRRREARLVAALLRRHIARLEQPPPWMAELRQTMVQIDEFLRWEEA